jgi:UDP-N-acetyl-D-glucosamine dehydrogenase
MNSLREVLTARLQDKTAHVVILGLGYVGLPLAAVFAEAGFTVTGVEPDESKVDAISHGESVQDVPTEQVARRWLLVN